MNNKGPFCVDCTYHAKSLKFNNYPRGIVGLEDIHNCVFYAEDPFDLVTGEIVNHIHVVNCKEERAIGLCGIQGEHFEKKI